MNSEFEIIVTDHIRLALPQKEWADLIFKSIEENRIFLKQWLPWVDKVHATRDTQLHLIHNRDVYFKGMGFSMAIIYQNEFAGFIGIHAFDTVNRVTSFGYWLSESQCGKGIMTQSVTALLRYVFEERQMNRVYLRCATENHPSRRIPERLGFTHEGTQRQAEWLYDHYVDLEVYSLLKREFSKITK